MRPLVIFNGFMSNVRVIKGTALIHIKIHTTNSTTHKCNQHKTSVLSVKSTTEFKNGAQPILNTNDTGITTTSGTRVDPFASSLVLALPLNGSNGGTTFTDQQLY